MSVSDVEMQARNDYGTCTLSENCKNAIPLIQKALLDGLGESTSSRRMSSKILKQDHFVLKATLLDPRFSTFWFTDVVDDVINTVVKDLENEVVRHALGEMFAMILTPVMLLLLL